MANKKLDPKKFGQQSTGRREGFRAERRYYLIVCEGKKTEKNYFEGLKKKLPQGVVSNLDVDVRGEGRNTLSLIDMALQRKAEIERDGLRTVDKIWVVFDRDSFPDQAFNAAISTCKRNDIDIAAAWSNEAFELWYLLHFAYYDSKLTRDQYKKKIEEHFKKTEKVKDFVYEKNHPDMFALLEKHLDTAIKNAKALKKSHKGTDHAKHNPCTTVHELVIELFALE